MTQLNKDLQENFSATNTSEELEDIVFTDETKKKRVKVWCEFFDSLKNEEFDRFTHHWIFAYFLEVLERYPKYEDKLNSAYWGV